MEVHESNFKVNVQFLNTINPKMNVKFMGAALQLE